jgi:hypothetical protein
LSAEMIFPRNAPRLILVLLQRPLSIGAEIPHLAVGTQAVPPLQRARAQLSAEIPLQMYGSQMNSFHGAALN